MIFNGIQSLPLNHYPTRDLSDFIERYKAMETESIIHVCRNISFSDEQYLNLQWS